MVGKKSGRALQKEQGLQRTDNNLGSTSWPQIPMINQKNYYTSVFSIIRRPSPPGSSEFLKRDDRVLSLRLQNEESRNRMMRIARDRDRALAQSGRDDIPRSEADIDAEDDAVVEENGALYDFEASKIVVLHPGSQNLRIGLASDALPKTVPMVIAWKSYENEAEEDGGEPRPKRRKLDNGTLPEPEAHFGEEFAGQFTRMSSEFKEYLRSKKHRLMPLSKDLVVNANKKVVPEQISEHNDPHRIEWTEVLNSPKQAPNFFTGLAALRIPEKSNPRYKLFWPIRGGTFNEVDYARKNILLRDLSTIIEDALTTQLNLTSKKEWTQYRCVIVIPDLYERVYVTAFLDMLLREFGFSRVCFIQESVAATFGAGVPASCVVGVGAQRTSICCIEDGMCVESSRINLQMGGADVTDTFIKMLLVDHFPYAEINLKRRYDFLLAEELKHRLCTMDEKAVTLASHEFHVRASGQDTRKYSFRTYDEVMLAPMGLFQPDILDHTDKLKGRRRVVERSYDLYDGSPNDPMSSAQASVLEFASDKYNNPSRAMAVNGTTSTPQQQLPHIADRPIKAEAAVEISLAGPAAAEGLGTPQPSRTDSPAPAPPDQATLQTETGQQAEERDRVLPVMPLDMAIIASITEGAHGDDRKMRDYFGGIMLTGGGAQFKEFHSFLEERLRILRPGYLKEILVAVPPRDLDPQVVVWKGGSVFGKLMATNDSWIGQLEYDRLGARVMAYKCMWPW